MIWHQDKTQLRGLLTARRAGLSLAERQKAEAHIVTFITQTPSWQAGQKIASYFPFKSEVDLSSLHKRAWKEKKALYLPVLQHDQLAFARYDSNTKMRLNQYQINEVDVGSQPLLAAEALDLILIPLLGFDRQGYRLGMGKGYYDKTLASLVKLKKRPVFIGVAFACQQVETLPVDPWDIPLDLIVTEKEMINSRIC